MAGPGAAAAADAVLRVGEREVRVAYVRHPRARRYVLRLRADGTARVTVPARGSLREAREFVGRQTAWMARELVRIESRPVVDRAWRVGGRILFRGEWVVLEAAAGESGAGVALGGEVVRAPAAVEDWRPRVERHLRGVAAGELPGRVRELALAAGLDAAVRRISVRDQRSRWGSCSRRGTISLNWRLVQAPPAVRDYVIWHELMHLREMNHSARFWREVAAVCPDHEACRAWLRREGGTLR